MNQGGHSTSQAQFNPPVQVEMGKKKRKGGKKKTVLVDHSQQNQYQQPDHPNEEHKQA